MDRSSGNSPLPKERFARLHAQEKQKAETALENFKQKCIDNPGKLKQKLAEISKEYGTWSAQQVQAYVKTVNPKFVESLLVPECPMSVNEYEDRIQNEIVKTLKKRTIAHYTNPEVAEQLLLAHQKAHQAETSAPSLKAKKAKQTEKRLWQETHCINPAEEKTFQVLGEGSFGIAESVFSGDGGPLVVKKTQLDGASLQDQQRFEQEKKYLKALDHPSIIRAAPASGRYTQANDAFYAEAGGVSLNALVDGYHTDSFNLDSLETDYHDAVLQHKHKIKKENLQLRHQIQDLVTEVVTKQHPENTHDAVIQKIEEIYARSHFSMREINEILQDIGQWDALIASDPKMVSFSDQLKEACLTWKPKAIPPLKTAGPLPMKRIEHIAKQVAQGIRHLHKNNMVHLDIKTENIVVQPDGKAKIIDFGLSMPRDQYIRRPVFCGTSECMAPEIIRKGFRLPSKCTEKVDVYALGCVIHELATGHFYTHSTKDDPAERFAELLDNTENQVDYLRERTKDLIEQRYSHSSEEEQESAILLEDLLKGMLDPNPDTRLSMKKVLEHPFFRY